MNDASGASGEGGASAVRSVELAMPRLGETMEEGVVRDWLVAVGEAFARGDPILEIETDKTIAEVPALAAGTLLERLAEPGQSVAVGAALARIEIAAAPGEAGGAGDADAPARTGSGSGSAAAHATAPGARARSALAANGEAGAPGRPPVAGAGRADAPVRATPAARRLARAAGIEIGSVRGTGARGRIESEDVRALAPGAGGATRVPAHARSGVPGARAAEARATVTDGVAWSAIGPRDGVPVLLLHGFAADRGAWAALAQALARGGCRAATPDLPGHGETSLEAVRAADLVRGLDRVVEAAFADAGDRAPVHLVAHSLGAAPALALAERMAPGSLSLIAPAGIGLAIDREFLLGTASAGSSGELAHLLRRLGPGSEAATSGAALEALAERLARGRLRELARSLLGAAGQTLDLVPAIGRLARERPVRALVGGADRVIDPGDVARLGPRVAVHHFPQAGHVPHWADPKGVAELLLAAFDRPRTARP